MAASIFAPPNIRLFALPVKHKVHSKLLVYFVTVAYQAKNREKSRHRSPVEQFLCIFVLEITELKEFFNLY